MSLEKILFPEIKPYNEGYLKLSDLHSIWYAEYGNPNGMPAVFLHGGPGYGCTERDMRFFDPDHYHIILFDQRGAKRSTPFAELREVSTEILVGDVDTLRKHLKINKWMVFGGSWGSTLAIAYGQTYPENCLGFVLRGIFLGRKEDINQLWYGMRRTFPEAWDEFQNFLPEHERNDLIAGYYKRLIDPDHKIRLAAAHAFMKYDLACAFAKPDQQTINKELEDEVMIIGVTKMCTYFSINNFFMKENHLIENMHKIQHLPAIIVHGRYDIICNAKTAYDLHINWPGSKLVIVENAGHTSTDLAEALVDATNEMIIKIKRLT